MLRHLCPLLFLATLAAASAANDLKVEFTGKLCSEAHCEPGVSTIGAEITGLRNVTALTQDDYDFIRKALVDYKVVYFRAAGSLFTPELQLHFGQQFGEVKNRVSKVPDYVEKGVHQSTHSVRHDDRTGADVTQSVNTMVEANKPENKRFKGKEMPYRVIRLVREPGDPFAFGEGYHSDVTFFQEPPYFTFLVGRDLPGGKDDTFYIDTARAYETLHPALKLELTGLTAVHNDSAGIESVHPAVRTHPESGEQAIFVNSHFVHKIVGYSDEESKALLDQVYDHIESQPVWKFKWTCDPNRGGPGQGTTHPDCQHVLMWDNRALQHTATTDWARDPVLNKRRRELHRVTISGQERPFYRSIPRNYATVSSSVVFEPLRLQDRNHGVAATSASHASSEKSEL